MQSRTSRYQRSCGSRLSSVVWLMRQVRINHLFYRIEDVSPVPMIVRSSAMRNTPKYLRLKYQCDGICGTRR